MGDFSMTCSASGLSIGGRTPRTRDGAAVALSTLAEVGAGSVSP